MLLLGIETSCDETSAALVVDGWHVKSCTIASSGKDFERMGGVIPEMAARKQLESILPTVELALKTANVTKDDVDAIAVTRGPGLLGSLLVGTTTANVLGSLWQKPLIPVHHTLGHLCSSILTNDAGSKPTLSFPILTLSVSGGHTDLWLRRDHAQGSLLGTTRDDAAGEAFDKGAVLLGLPYPGGPHVEKMAAKGNEHAYDFPHPLRSDTSMEFSYSGLKTSLKYLLQKLGPLTEVQKADVAASYQKALVDHACDRLKNALTEHPEIKEVHIVGGVSANTALRTAVQKLAQEFHVVCRFPTSLRFCTDNAAMIASAGYFLNQHQEKEVPAIAAATIELCLK